MLLKSGNIVISYFRGFFRNRVVNIVIFELGPVSNERPGNFTIGALMNF